MKHRASRRQRQIVRDVADPFVSEVEPLANAVEHPPPHELLEAGRRVACIEAGGALQDGEVEVAADHGGHHRQLARGTAETVEPGLDQMPHALGERQLAALRALGALLEPSP